MDTTRRHEQGAAARAMFGDKLLMFCIGMSFLIKP